MIKVLILLLTSLVFAIASGLAGDKRPVQNWDDVEGVTVQPGERVDQINAYKKKSEEAEKKKLQEGWEQQGITVQSDERVHHLNELEKDRREKEVLELKCKICTLRCTIVRDFGQSTCQDSQSPPDTGICKQKADDFLKTCLQRCEHC
ncbi:MAG: hypothetical protein ACRERU_14150 [Methylococcales bacterium]